jgi:hypothetical protein
MLIRYSLNKIYIYLPCALFCTIPIWQKKDGIEQVSSGICVIEASITALTKYFVSEIMPRQRIGCKIHKLHIPIYIAWSTKKPNSEWTI